MIFHRANITVVGPRSPVFNTFGGSNHAMTGTMKTNLHLAGWLAAALCAAAPGAGAQAVQDVQPQQFPGYLNFQGGYLAVLSDADMVASAYMGPPIGPRTDQMRDMLTLFPLSGGLPGPAVATPVTNAVTAWPSLLGFTPDGRTAYVAETERPAAPGMTSRNDLQPSNLLSVVSIGEDLAGRVVQEIETSGRAVAVAVRPQGDVLAVSTTRPGRQADDATVADGPQLGVFGIGQNGRLGEMTLVPLADAESDPPHIEWSPDGRLLAITMAGTNGVRVYAWNGETLTPHGNLVVSGKLPGVGHWAPDGGHFFVTNLYWGGDTENLYVGSEVSTVAAIRVAPPEAEDPRHVMVSAVAVGASAEEFAVSPDGTMLVSLNMERSFLAPDDPRLTYHSSLTLMTWDADRERLHARTTTPFEGILPEGITFDASGRFLAVANFAHANPKRPVEETTVDFWRVVAEPVPMLVQMDLKLPVMRGAHVVKLVQPR